VKLDATDPRLWRDAALDWQRWAAAAGRWAAELRSCAAGLRAVWTGAAADALATRIGALVLRLQLFRLDCWAADQALDEFAAAISRAKPGGDIAAATAADDTAARLLHSLFSTDARPPGVDPPSCTAAPAEVAGWWAELSPAQRDWLSATQPGWIGSLDGLPAAARDRANRLLLDGMSVENPLPEGDGPRAYLLDINPSGDGQAVVALGDPDKADHVVTQVPGMTADLASYGGELARAERIAVRAAELAPDRATSAIMWLGYDAPDFVGEAAGRSSANAGAAGLRRFQEGLRSAHEGTPARQTVIGHSYGSLVVGTAAARPGFDADSLVFVGSPGVGVDSAADLHAPAGEVWASTSYSDVIQYTALSPRSIAEDAVLSQVGPAGALLAFGRPEDDLYFGTNPADPAFGARRFASQPGAGHLGYWDEGGPALDALATIALGRGDVIPR